MFELKVIWNVSRRDVEIGLHRTCKILSNQWNYCRQGVTRLASIYSSKIHSLRGVLAYLHIRLLKKKEAACTPICKENGGFCVLTKVDQVLLAILIIKDLVLQNYRCNFLFDKCGYDCPHFELLWNIVHWISLWNGWYSKTFFCISYLFGNFKFNNYQIRFC